MSPGTNTEVFMYCYAVRTTKNWIIQLRLPAPAKRYFFSSHIYRKWKQNMLACSHLHHHSKLQIHGSFSFSKPHNSTPSTLLHLSSTLHANPCTVSSSIVNQLKQTDENNYNIENPKEILRRHNAKSSSLLLHGLSHRRQNEQQAQEPIDKEENLEGSIPEEEKVKILELSLVTRRTPQFPGSVYIRSPDEISKPPLHKLFDDGSSGRDWDENDKTLIRAIEIRRKVTVEIMKEAMRKGKFGITYSTNLISLLPDFIDHVMIEAAWLKNSPEFAKFPFNARAKTFIDDSDVVPLIRCPKRIPAILYLVPEKTRGITTILTDDFYFYFYFYPNVLYVFLSICPLKVKYGTQLKLAQIVVPSKWVSTFLDSSQRNNLKFEI